MQTPSGTNDQSGKFGGLINLKNLLLTVGGLSVILGMFLISGLQFSDLWRGIKAVPLVVFVLIILVQSLILLIAAVKWRIILDKLPGSERSLPLGDALGATTWGALAGQVLPIQLVTPPIRAWVARKHKISAARAIGTSVFEQVFEVLILAAMAAMSVLIITFQFSLTVTLGATLALAVVATLLVGPGLQAFSKVLAVIAGVSANSVAALLSKLSGAAQDAAKLPRKALFQLTSLSFLRYALLAGLNVWILALVAPSVDPLTLIFAYPLILLVISLPFIPGGLGVVELTWVGVLVGAGLSSPEAVEAALVVRIISTMAFLVAVPALIAFQSRG